MVTSPMENHPELVRIFAYGPAPHDSGQRTVHNGLAQWTLVGGHVRLWCALPGTTVGAKGTDVFRALIGARTQLEEQDWMLLVKGARHDAWHSTPEHPCPLDEAMLYPDFGRPPVQRIHVLDAEPDVEFLAHTAVEQLMYRDEWAGTTPPGQLTWTQATASRREAIAAWKRGNTSTQQSTGP